MKSYDPRRKYKIGDRVVFVYAGPRHNKKATVLFVRSDGHAVVHVDGTPDGSILVVHPMDVDKVK